MTGGMVIPICQYIQTFPGGKTEERHNLELESVIPLRNEAYRILVLIITWLPPLTVYYEYNLTEKTMHLKCNYEKMRLFYVYNVSKRRNIYK